MINLYNKFDKIDASINRWLVRYSVILLRISMGAVFFGFGVLKFFPNVSPAQSIATHTLSVMSFGLLPASVSIVFVASLECAIGLCFLTGKFLRIAVWLLLFELIGILSPLVLLPGELFTGPFHAPNLLGQYVLKDVILAGAGMVIAANLRKASLSTKYEVERERLSTSGHQMREEADPLTQPVPMPGLLKNRVIPSDDMARTILSDARENKSVSKRTISRERGA
ncbi:MAG: DoxX family protein [Ktedonobacteraceae bacterium]|nr:DoxX family protein [Ktedonobacteraceae bacterium]